MQRIYLDNAATTAVSAEVLESMIPYLSNVYGNPSSLHNEGRAARIAVETARKFVAQILGCLPGEIFFTSCGTESANTAIRAVVRDLKINQIISSRTEHPCVLQTVRSLHQSGDVSLSYVALKENGEPDLMDLNRLLEDARGRCLVTLMHANNETGAMINLERTGEICRRHKAVFHSDTVQTVGHYPFDLKQLPVDLITGSSHKFHGPKGTGILYVREGLGIRSLLTGGGQERGLRAGTENVAGIAGFAFALQRATDTHIADMIHIGLLREALCSALEELGAVSNSPAEGLYTVLNMGFPKNELTENLLMEMDMAGISISGGSACSAAKGGSTVMEAMGKNNTVNLRFSFSRYNTMEEIHRTAGLLESRLLKKQAYVHS